jgi:UDP-N-acetylmuramate: L-alanyl-gamma-D-glutamyl-meso-diaminopimelate ligase
VNALARADDIVLAGLFRPERYTRETGLDPAVLVNAWQGAGKTADYIPQVDEIVARLNRSLTGGEVVVFMSNGGFGGIHAKLLDTLHKRNHP